MKNALYSSVVIVFIILILSSFRHKENETTSALYLKCIKMHIQNEKEDTIHIMQDDIVQLPSHIGNHFIKKVDYTNLDFFAAQSIYILKILPIQIENKYLVITLSDYIAATKNNESALSYTGGKKYYFKYDCPTEKYTFYKSATVSF